jgi:N-acetylglucosaminyl-diphospho-decaprenol L-rhamnosyltransferase
MTEDAPVLSAVAPHWHDEEHLAVLVRDWPTDARFELIVVDNGSDGDLTGLSADRSNVRLLDPGRNLGFGAAVNRGVAEAGGDLILILNTDAVPDQGALDTLVEAMANHPEAAGLAPRLLGSDDAAQAGWQLRRLPTLRTLVGYCCFVEPAPLPEPAGGTPVEQPAACALLLRRAAFENAGAMDERFWPAWFEDVDLARRLADRGEQVLYWPDAVFRHGLGASVPRLGYGAFLAAYYRNLVRYARKHDGRGAALLLRAVLGGAAVMRILVLPLRRPRRARDRGEAFGGLWRLAAAAVTGWRGR